MNKVTLPSEVRNELSGLDSREDNVSELLADALRETLDNKAAPEEKAWIERIESLRARLGSSTTEMSVTDYGAGSRDISLTPEEMSRGRVISRTIGEVARKTSKPYPWSLLLFKLVRKFGPSVCLELGTSLGISASYQAAALKLNHEGEIVTLEGAESSAVVAEDNFRGLDIDNVTTVVGRFQDTLDSVLDKYGPIDFAFIDGHHDEQATLAYFDQIYPSLSERAILIFDDISWSAGMKRAWADIESDMRIKLTVGLHQLGICFLDSGVGQKQSLDLKRVGGLLKKRPASAQAKPDSPPSGAVEDAGAGRRQGDDFVEQQKQLGEKLDSVRAELGSERKRERELVAKLHEKDEELRRIKSEYTASDRERKSFQHQYVSIVRSRTWRSTVLARKLVGSIRSAIRPAPNRGESVKSSESYPSHGTSTQATTRDRNLEQHKLNQHTLAQHRIRVNQLKIRLQSLGFTERALEDLQNLAKDDSEPALQIMAVRELALWHANQQDEEGARRCLELLSGAARSDDNPIAQRQNAILEAECQEVLGNTEAARGTISRALASESNADLFLANANLETSGPAKVEWINKALQLHEMTGVSLDDSTGHPLLDSIKSAQAPEEQVELSSSAKVSVIMPVFNAQDVIQTSLDSVLSQTWSNLEVLVVDDCSSDETVALVEEYAKRDPRVQLMGTETNGGPYVARNLALKAATGDFVTCHDADDWSHPEKIERQVRHLLENPSVIGNTSQLARVTPELEFYRRGNPGFYIFSSMPSFMFRREPVIGAVGYWDCVRFGADTEFVRRLKKIFGEARIVNVETGPLSFQRQSASSLTGNKFFGYHGYFAGARREYFEAHNYFHDTAKSLRYEFPQDERPFAIPEPMWPVREARKNERRHFDVILASDFRLMGGPTSSNVEEIKAQKRMGLRTGLVKMSRYDLNPNRKINPEVRELLDGDDVQMLVYGEKVSCDVLVLRYPPILQDWQRFVPNVEAKSIHVIVNQTPMRDYGDEGELAYEIGRCEKHLQRYFGKAAVWHPIGPLIREALHQHHAEELAEITLSDEDWPNIIDVEEWWRGSRPPRGRRPRIGRHSRDAEVKWPADRNELLAAYPDSDDYEVHVMGGAKVPERVLGGLPENWRVLGFGEVHPKDFLSTLDVFVYYTHPDWVESFGRSIFEAMAVGVPVILPPVFRSLFEEAAIYAEPSEVKENIDRLMTDDDYYEAQVKVARDYVEGHFGYTKHAARLTKELG